LLARLPRTTWDWIRTGEVALGADDDLPPELKNGKTGGAPDFHTLLSDQMRIVQARIEDAIVLAPQSRAWMSPPNRGGLDAALIDPNEAATLPPRNWTD
jgi:hypothetical protein